jgi:hypothetical protein
VTGILGPAPCIDCGSPLLWDGHRWSMAGQRGHLCTRALCMTPDEWSEWRAFNARLHPDSHSWAGSPCVDCTPAFAAMQRAIYRCNGEPGRIRRLAYQPADPVQEARRAGWRVAQQRHRAVVA